jgi:hypothetical protein
LTQTTSFDLEVTGACDVTTIHTNYDLNNRHFQIVDNPAESWTFSEFTDEISMNVNEVDPTIKPWETCLSRTYTISNIVNENGETLFPYVISLNGRRLTLKGYDSTYVGIHTITIRVELDEYSVAPFYQSFRVWIAGSCRQTAFYTNDDPVVDMNDISVNVGKQKQRIPVYFTTTEK